MRRIHSMKCWPAIRALPRCDSVHDPCFGQKSYDIHRVTSPITIDGKLDESAWKAAPSVGDFDFPWFKEGEKRADSREDALG